MPESTLVPVQALGELFTVLVMLSAAADARCRLLLSEGLQEGFTWRGVTVTNPFSSRPHPLLEALISA